MNRLKEISPETRYTTTRVQCIHILYTMPISCFHFWLPPELISSFVNRSIGPINYLSRSPPSIVSIVPISFSDIKLVLEYMTNTSNHEIYGLL